MPIQKQDDGRFVLRCINGCTHKEYAPSGLAGLYLREQAEKEGKAAPQPTTMRFVQGWHALIVVQPPVAGTDTKPRVPAMFNANGGLVMKCFVCTVCGYTEMYHGPTLEPATWDR